MERQRQRDSAIDAAMAIRQLFYIEGDVLERVATFRYLGRILSQDDDDIRAVRNQIKKARGIWARVSQVLQAENIPPRISAMFYGSGTVCLIIQKQVLEPISEGDGAIGGFQHSGGV